MATKINNIIKLSLPSGIMNTSWLESLGLSRTEQVKYVKSGWLTRMSTGIYRLSNSTPTLYAALASYEKQMGKRYRIGASAALELQGYTHYVALGKPQTFVFTSFDNRLPKWLTSYEWERTLKECSTKVFDGSIGVTHIEYEGFTLQVSTPELAIMECLLLAPEYYNLMDIYYLMEMLTTLRAGLVTKLLEQCSSFKVKRLFLYMAEKSKHSWFKRLDLSKVTLGSGPRSLCKGGVRDAKYNIIIPKELADYE
ncbi:type IV toxin-antitoxin system AbiEi family antitoxin [Segatella paludivivens]|uniref:type IV toxin-antitoxin system AbiEi family antitoxin n=1 Tax=Segatella paludivivens TaxID=185294 RepID=UPI00036AA95F|nr:type IV toxin-antitoxin system AbiEi family antitoxin [Segatella paludivivens]